MFSHIFQTLSSSSWYNVLSNFCVLNCDTTRVNEAGVGRGQIEITIPLMYTANPHLYHVLVQLMSIRCRIKLCNGLHFFQVITN